LERELVAGASRDYYGRRSRATLVLLTLVIVGGYAAVAVAAVFGVLMAASRDRRGAWLLLLVVGFIWGVHTVVFGHSRYHLPAIVLMMPFSAAAMSGAGELWRRRRGTPAWWAACAASGVLVLVWVLEVTVLDRARFFTIVHSS
jgi:hypothetical protein